MRSSLGSDDSCFITGRLKQEEQVAQPAECWNFPFPHSLLKAAKRGSERSWGKWH
jgi:hypothetical protein